MLLIVIVKARQNAGKSPRIVVFIGRDCDIAQAASYMQSQKPETRLCHLWFKGVLRVRERLRAYYAMCCGVLAYGQGGV